LPPSGERSKAVMVDPKRAERVMQAMHTMVKLDLAKLEEAAR
jgi:hypothetical protein